MIAAEYQQLFSAGGVHCLLTPTAATAARSFDELRAQTGVEGYLGTLSNEAIVSTKTVVIICEA